MGREKIRQQLVDHYLDFYAVAYSLLKNDEDAREAVQEALVRTLTRPFLKDACGYCVKVINNLCTDTYRRRQRLVEMEETMLVSNPEEEELFRLVAAKKSELPEMARRVLELHYEDGYTIKEISDMLQVNASKLKRILASATVELKEKLKYEI